MAKKKKGAGGKLSRTETVAVRLDPKLRFAAELAARKQRRTLSGFIEWSIVQSVNEVKVGQGDDESETTIANMAMEVWDVDEADRFAKLAYHYPDFLSHDEEVLWKLIKTSPFLWQTFDDNFEWSKNIDNLDFTILRKHWDQINEVARGEADKDILPKEPFE